MQAAIADLSPLALERQQYVPQKPEVLSRPANVSVSVGEQTVARSNADDATLTSWFHNTSPQPIVNLSASPANAPSGANSSNKPLRVAVAFNGRQSPGANNLVVGACLVWLLL